MKLLKPSLYIVSLMSMASLWADSFEATTNANPFQWGEAKWTKVKGSSKRTAPGAGDEAKLNISGGYNDISTLDGIPQLSRFEIVHTGQKSHSGTFFVKGDFIVKAATKTENGKEVAANDRSHVAFASGWVDGSRSKIEVKGDMWLCDYAVNRGDSYINLGGRQSSMHDPANCMDGLIVHGNMNIVNQNVFIQMSPNAPVKIDGLLNFPENINGRSGTLAINANNRQDDDGVLSQTVKFGGISSAESSKAVIGTRTGSTTAKNLQRFAAIEITGKGGVFYGSIKDGISASDTLGRVSLTMKGRGVQKLVGESSFSGPVSVNSGTLLMTSKSGLGEVTVNKGGVFGAIQDGVKAQKLVVNPGGKIEFDLSAFNTSITLEKGAVIADPAGLLDSFKFRIIGGQREYLLLKDLSNPKAFEALNGVEKVYTDTQNVTQMARFIASGDTLKVIFPDANPLPEPELPNVGEFEIRPAFEGVTVAAGKPFKFFIVKAPAGASYKVTRNMGTVVDTGELKEGQNVIELVLDEPGDAELVCENVFEKNSAGANAKLNRFAFMVSPDDLKMTYERPKDFDAYWKKRKAEVEAVIPSMELKKERETEKYTLYTFNVRADGYELYGKNYADKNNPRVNLCGIVASGYMAVPRNQGKGPFPAIVTFYGAGSYGADSRDAANYAEMGMIGFSMNPHAIKQSDDPSVREALAKQLQNNTGWYYRDRNIDDGDPKKIYFNGMFKRCYQTLRAAMAMQTSTQGIELPKWDGKNLITRGFSQGGAQTIAASYLCPQVSAMTPWCPALCNIGAGKIAKRCGWPSWVNTENYPVRDQIAPYFDVGLMAQSIKADSFVMVGLIDGTCPPDLVTPSFNGIPAKNKRLFYMQRMAHGITPEAADSALAFIKKSIEDR